MSRPGVGKYILCAICTSVGAVCCKQCHQKYKQIESDRSHTLANVIPLDKLLEQPNNKRFILQLYVTKNVGIVKLFKQTVVTKTKAVPHNITALQVDSKTGPSVGTQLGVSSYNSQVVGFATTPNSVHLSDHSFGFPDIHPNSNEIKNILELMQLEPKPIEVKGFGGEVDKWFWEKCGLEFNLSNKQVYKALYYPFAGKTLYLSGIKYGNKFIYDRFSTNPKIVAEYGMSNGAERFGMFVGGVTVAASMCVAAELISRL